MTTDPTSGQPDERRPGESSESTPPPPPPGGAHPPSQAGQQQPGGGYPQYPSGEQPPPPGYGQQPGGYPQYPTGEQPPPGWGPPPMQNDSNTMSTIAIVLGVAAIVIAPIILGPIAIVLAVLAKRRNEPRARTALWVAIGGMVVGFIVGAVLYSSMVA